LGINNGGTGISGVETFHMSVVVNGTTWPGTLVLTRIGGTVQVAYSSGATAISCPAGTYPITIPTGYRPVQITQYSCSNAAFFDCFVTPQGEFRIRLSSALSGATWVYFWGTWITSESISYVEPFTG
jgi:hypothetical protein